MGSSVFTVIDENGSCITLSNIFENIQSTANVSYNWIVDFRPFCIMDDTENKRTYLADNKDTIKYHEMDEKFIREYEPRIIEDAFGNKSCCDVKLPSGRWLEKITIEDECNGNITFKALVDAYGTYNEQR